MRSKTSDSSLHSSALTEDQFKAVAATGYNNMYGYLPSKYCTNNTCATNTAFLPAPNLTGDILDITENNNNEEAREYTVAIGARVDNLKPMGTYTNTFEVLLVSNAIPYTIIFDDNVVSNIKYRQTQSGQLISLTTCARLSLAGL